MKECKKCGMTYFNGECPYCKEDRELKADRTALKVRCREQREIK